MGLTGSMDHELPGDRAASRVLGQERSSLWQGLPGQLSLAGLFPNPYDRTPARNTRSWPEMGFRVTVPRGRKRDFFCSVPAQGYMRYNRNVPFSFHTTVS